MGRELEVWLFDDFVGRLTWEGGRLAFQYASGWIAQPEAYPLSCSLPLQVEPFGSRQTRPFFSGLLPEGHLRRLIAQQFQVSVQNDFALLEGLGGECAGAVTFTLPGERPSQGAAEVRWLSEPELGALLEELPRRPMLAGNDGLRLSLAGAQDKLPVVFDGQRIGVPRNGGPSTHILKPAILAVEDSVSNEGFCLALAESVGLLAARAEIHVAGGHRFLLVERYDRRINAGQIARLHQEDLCQALGVPSEIKYQNEGGPSLPACFDLVRKVTRPSAPEVLRLLDYVIFNALIGNHDAHGKNFSLLRDRKSLCVAPLYDALSTAIYPTLTSKMAMKVGSKYQFREVQARHWDQLAEGAGLSPAQTRKRVMSMAHRLPAAARALQADAARGFAGLAVVEQVVEIVERRSALTLQRLSGPAAASSPSP